MDWWSLFSHPEYVRFSSAIQTAERTAAEVEGLRRMLDLRPGTRLLDLGCGSGRLSLPLARLGCAVTGLDASALLLDEARRAALAEGLEVELVESHMRDLDARAEYDVVVNAGTALGYVPDERDDAAALCAARRALVPGGRLLVDTENREHTLRKGRRVWFDMAGATVWCDRRPDLLTGRWHETMRWRNGGEERGVEYSLRLYSLTELAALLRGAGFAVAGVCGDFTGAPYDVDSPRMIVLATASATDAGSVGNEHAASRAST
jgi:SAM-dependent methyltransferase